MRAWPLKRIASEVIAVQFDQVEGVEEDALVAAVVTDEIERRNAIVIAGNSLAVDDAGARAQATASSASHSASPATATTGPIASSMVASAGTRDGPGSQRTSCTGVAGPPLPRARW